MDCQHWCIVTKSRVGQVSIHKGLTKHEADEIQRRIDPSVGFRERAQAWRDAGNEGPYSEAHIGQDDDLVLVEVFHAGPECDEADTEQDPEGDA